MGEAEWEDLRRRFRLWHSPIGELLEHTDSGREGVLLDYAYASSRVDTGTVIVYRAILRNIRPTDCTLRNDDSVPLCFIGDAGYTVK